MVKFSGGKAAATLLLAAAILAPPTTMGYMDFEHMSTPELEDILGALEEEAAAGDYRDVEPSGDDYVEDYYRGAEEGNPDYVYNLDEELQPGDNYFLPEELSIQQRQQEDFSHGTPIASSGVPAYISASGGGTAKANPPKNSGAVLPAYCDPPNPCPIGYTAKDGCISLEEFENTSEFSREFQSRQNCLCDSEHMFNCPEESEEKAAAAQNPAFLAGMPPSLDSQLPAGVGAKLVAKKGVGL